MNPFARNPAKLPVAPPARVGEEALQDFVADAHSAMLQQDPARARILVWLVALTLAALLAWAYYAEVDELARGEGKVISSRHLQVLQSLDGGIVNEILVQEGQAVMEG